MQREEEGGWEGGRGAVWVALVDELMAKEDNNFQMKSEQP